MSVQSLSQCAETPGILRPPPEYNSTDSKSYL